MRVRTLAVEKLIAPDLALRPFFPCESAPREGGRCPRAVPRHDPGWYYGLKYVSPDFLDRVATRLYKCLTGLSLYIDNGRSPNRTGCRLLTDELAPGNRSRWPQMAFFLIKKNAGRSARIKQVLTISSSLSLFPGIGLICHE